MDSGNKIAVTGNFAADEFPQVDQYKYGSPSYYLNKIIAAGNGNLEFSESKAKALMRYLPSKMVGMKSTGKATEYSIVEVAECFKGAQDGLIGSGIVNVLVSDVIAEGAQGVASMRQIMNVLNMGSGAVKFPAWTKRKPAPIKAKNAEYADIAQDLMTTLIDTKEYGYTATISNSILEDTSGSFMSSVLREMGAGMELTIDKAALEALINFSGTANAVSKAVGDALSGLTIARAKVAKNGYNATAAAVSPMFMAQMINTYIPGNVDRAMSLTIEGVSLPKFAGLAIGETATVPSGSVVFDWEAVGNVGAIAFDPSRAPIIGMRKDITFDEFDNILKYATNPTVIMRFGMSDPMKAEGPDGKALSTADANELKLAAARVVVA